jgi:hypothetical protein
MSSSRAQHSLTPLTHAHTPLTPNPKALNSVKVCLSQLEQDNKALGSELAARQGERVGFHRSLTLTQTQARRVERGMRRCHEARNT